MDNFGNIIRVVFPNDLFYNEERRMTKKKTSTPKTVAKKVSTPKKVSKKSPKVVKEVTTVETRETDGSWVKTTVVKYVKSLLCPAFFSNRLIVTLAAIPLLILIGVIIWRIFGHE